MRQTDVAKLNLGLYRVYWKQSSGGMSWAAVGMTASGQRWFAPTNWLTVPAMGAWWKQVEQVEEVCS